MDNLYPEVDILELLKLLNRLTDIIERHSKRLKKLEDKSNQEFFNV